MAQVKYETIAIGDKSITVDVTQLIGSEALYFNATSLAKEFGKDIQSFMRKKETIAYIELLAKDPTVLKTVGLKAVITNSRGKNQGTWLHHKVALRFTRWLSVEFEYKLDRWIEEKIKEEKSRKVARLAAKTGFPKLTMAIMEDHEDPKGYHYSNEVNMVYRIMFGMSAKEYKLQHGVGDVRHNLTPAQGAMHISLQELNTSLIRLNMSFEERKSRLTAYFNNKQG